MIKDNKLHRIRYVDGSETVKVWETRVLITTTTSITVTLPAVAKCKGLIFTLRVTVTPNTPDTIEAEGAEEFIWDGTPTTLTFTGQHAYAVLLSTGTYWLVLGFEGRA